MRVLGIDPGLTRCGYAVVDADRPQPTPVAIGVIATPVDADLPERLARLKVDITALLEEYRPDVV
ncbi:MAG: crossover junction endodeoxyribonuclease RuvC, partial [Ilumatobacteraceae bacterium]|nr:crossover junction endodeoxyribonuclease RuvC [Ilumatobacteraceae bacterium]